MPYELPRDVVLLVCVRRPPGRPGGPQLLHNGCPGVLFEMIIHALIGARQNRIILIEPRKYFLQVLQLLLTDTTVMEERSNSGDHRPASVNSEILIK